MTDCSDIRSGGVEGVKTAKRQVQSTYIHVIKDAVVKKKG